MHRDHHKYDCDHVSFTINYLLVSQGTGTGSGHRTLLYGNAVLLRHLNSNMVNKYIALLLPRINGLLFAIVIVYLTHQYFRIKYLACLSTSSSNDKLAFDVGLQEQSQGKQI